MTIHEQILILCNK